MVQEHLIELRVGETLQVGQYKVTLLDVDGDVLCVQVDGDDDNNWSEDLIDGDLLHMV